MSIFKHTVDLTVAIPETAPKRVPVGGATGLYFIEVPSDAFIRLDDAGDFLPIGSAQQLLALPAVRNVEVHNNNSPGGGDLVLLAFTAGEYFAL